MTKTAFKSIFADNVLTYVSDREVDYKLASEDTDLSCEQKKILTEELGQSVNEVINIRQVHGKGVVMIPDNYVRGSYAIQEADAVTTRVKDLWIAVRTADCLSIFIHDPVNDAIAVVHAGWGSSYLDIAGETVRVMQRTQGSNPCLLKVAFGPSIRSCCYEVQDDLVKKFPEAITKRDGKTFLDIPLVNKRQLVSAGVKEENIADQNECTYCSGKYFSFRKEGDAAGRMILLMMLKS